jgi:hypothetical protein
MEAMNSIKWESLDTNSFWAGMKEKDHVLHIYHDDKSLLNSLTGFASACFQSDLAQVIIASKPHLDLLDKRLRQEGYDVFGQTVSGKYLALEARDILGQFMFNGVPDSALFSYMLTSFSLRSRRLGKGIRFFGELAGILHAEGNHKAAAILENLWDQYRATAPFCFFRALKAGDLPEQPTADELARYSYVISDQTSRSTVSFHRL